MFPKTITYLKVKRNGIYVKYYGEDEQLLATGNVDINKFSNKKGQKLIQFLRTEAFPGQLSLKHT